MTSPRRHAGMHQFFLSSPTTPPQHSLFLSYQLFIFLDFIYLHTKKDQMAFAKNIILALSWPWGGNEAGVTSWRPAQTGKWETNVLTAGCALAPSPGSSLSTEPLAQRKTRGRKRNEAMKASHLQNEDINMISLCDFKISGPPRPQPDLFIERTAGLLTSSTYWLCSQGQAYNLCL